MKAPTATTQPLVSYCTCCTSTIYAVGTRALGPNWEDHRLHRFWRTRSQAMQIFQVQCASWEKLIWLTSINDSECSGTKMLWGRAGGNALVSCGEFLVWLKFISAPKRAKAVTWSQWYQDGTVYSYLLVILLLLDRAKEFL